MPHGTHEHLEEAEHAEHALHDDFNRNVATTMAIIAAVLAAAALLSHRSHTETLRLQSLSNVRHTQASDQWTYFQAKNIRSHQYAMFTELVDTMAPATVQTEPLATAKQRWMERIQEYAKEMPELQARALALEGEADAFQERSHTTHHKADRFDLGELGIELGLVLASLAILTRRRLFWLGGIVSAGLGVVIAASAFFLH